MAPTPKHSNPPADELKTPLTHKVVMSLSSASIVAKNALEMLSFPIYNIILGLNPAVVSAAIAAGHGLELVIRPWIGAVSDNCKSKWGRRRPFIFWGGIALGLSIPLLWFAPRGLAHGWLALYLFSAITVFSVCCAIYEVPRDGLLYGLATDRHDRVHLQAFFLAFTFAFNLLSLWMLRIIQSPYFFTSTITGLHIVALILGAIVIPFTVLPALLVPERPQLLADRRSGLNLIEGIKVTFANKAFVIVCGVLTASGLANGMVAGSAVGFYIINYYVYGNDLKSAAFLAGLLGTLTSIITVVTAPIFGRLAVRIGKVALLRWGIVILIVASASKWFTYRPEHPYATLITATLLALGYTVLMLTTRSLVADICDDDELKTGFRREGTFCAFLSWFDSGMRVVAILLSGIVMVAVGFRRELGTNQVPEALTRMRLAFSLIPITGTVTSLVMLAFFPLTDKQTKENQAKLLERYQERVDQAGRPGSRSS
ncbi:MAG: MFS transporter [Opitutaceae bacterium]|jgi:GPH family glycoside/pentoside/hexuronide:cation symporter